MDNDPKYDPRNDPQSAQYVDPDDAPATRENVRRLSDSPAFDPKAHPHLYFLGQATWKIELAK